MEQINIRGKTFNHPTLFSIFFCSHNDAHSLCVWWTMMFLTEESFFFEIYFQIINTYTWMFHVLHRDPSICIGNAKPSSCHNSMKFLADQISKIRNEFEWNWNRIQTEILWVQTEFQKKKHDSSTSTSFSFYQFDSILIHEWNKVYKPTSHSLSMDLDRVSARHNKHTQINHGSVFLFFSFLDLRTLHDVDNCHFTIPIYIHFTNDSINIS